MSKVTALGPMWVAELKADIMKRRSSTADTASHCKPDGDYRKQMEMVIAELDAMLAAHDLLAALQKMVERIEHYSAHPDDRPNIEHWEYTEGSADMRNARAAIAKATGKPA